MECCKVFCRLLRCRFRCEFKKMFFLLSELAFVGIEGDSDSFCEINLEGLSNGRYDQC